MLKDVYNIEKGKSFLLFIYLISCGSYRIHMLWDISKRFLFMKMINGILVWILLVIKGRINSIDKKIF